MLASGEISFNELTHDQKVEWAAWEPDPLPMDSFSLADPEQREDFLYQYCYYGEPLLLSAVAHIWDSLAEPREWRCIKIGLASGTGGTGKMALVLTLQKMLAECVEIGPVMPRGGEFDDIDAHHQAVTDHWTSTYEQERALCRVYGKILDG